MLPSFSPKRQVVQGVKQPKTAPFSRLSHHVWVPWQHRVHIFLPLPVFLALGSL